MTRLEWDKTGERLFETGVKNAVIYTKDEHGKFTKADVWNGIVGVTESPSGAESTPLYADDIKYVNLISAEEFGATIEAYMYPDVFAKCDGSAELKAGITIGQQPRETFGFAYKTTIGNDVNGQNHGYKLHILYNCLAAPSEKSFQTINDNPDAITFSWEVSTTPINVKGAKPTALLTIDSTKVSKENMTKIEDALFGSDTLEPKLLTPDEIAALIVD